MRIISPSLFCEVGYSFEIPYKIKLLIVKKLNEMVISKYGFDKIQPNLTLSFMVSTSSITYKVEVKGPDINKRQRTKTWGLWLPYKEITEAEDSIKEYIKCYFMAAETILNEFNVNQEDVQNVRKEVEEAIRINPEEYL